MYNWLWHNVQQNNKSRDWHNLKYYHYTIIIKLKRVLVLIHQRLSVEQCLCVACVISVFIWLTRRPRMKIKRMKTINKPPIEIIFHSSIRRGASVSSLSWLFRLLASLFSVGDSGDNDDEGDVDTVVSICWDDVTDGAIVLSFWTPCNGAVKTGIQGRKTHVRLNSLLWDM